MDLSANSLRGYRVTNYDNENLGEIEDFVLDSATGAVEYALLSCHCIDGTGKRLVPVPLRAMMIDAEAGFLTLNADRETIRHAPGFQRHQWPDTLDPRWRSGVQSYYSF